MKKIFFTVVAVAALAVALVGCKKSNVDTSRVESAFKDTSPSVKSNADMIISQVKTNNYSGAMGSLQQALASAKLTPEQQTALQDLGTQLKNKIGEEAKKAAGEAGAAGSNAAKSAQDLFKK